MNILSLADTRFPIERANGVQTMATCRAVAMRRHSVTLLVRPDSQTPARDPFEFYGWPATPSLHIEVVPTTRHLTLRRAEMLWAGMRHCRAIRVARNRPAGPLRLKEHPARR